MGTNVSTVIENRKYVLLCLICQKEIPDLSFRIEDNTMYIRLFCKPNNLEKFYRFDDYVDKIKTLPSKGAQCSLHKAKGYQFCVSCDQWTCTSCVTRHKKYKHLLFDFEYHVVCSKHKKDYCYYNKFTQDIFCKDCKIPPNQISNYIPIEPVDMTAMENEFRNIFAIVNRVKKRKHQMVTMINRDKNQLFKQRFYSQWIHELDDAEKYLNVIYHVFALIVPLLLNTVVELKPHYHYQLMKLSQKIQIKNEDISLDPKNLEMSFVLTSNLVRRSLRLHKVKKRELKANTIKTDMNCCIGTISIQRNVYYMRLYHNNQIITCLTGGVIKLWDRDTLQCNLTISLNKELRYVGLFNDNNRIITLNDCELTLRNSITFKRLDTVGVGSVLAFRELHNGYLATGISLDFVIKLWSSNSLKTTSNLVGHTGNIKSLLELKSKLLLSGSEDLTLRVWDTDNYQCLTTVHISKFGIIHLFELDNRNICLLKNEKSIRVWEKDVFRVIKRPLQSKIKKCIFKMISLTDGRYASYKDKQSKIQIWDDSSFRTYYTIDHESGTEIRCIFLLDKNHLLICSRDGILKIWFIE